MKIDSHMQILIGGKVYKAEGITRIEINGTDFEMDYEWGKYTLKCNAKDVELFTDKPSMCDVLLPDETGYMPHEFVYPSQGMSKAIKEAIEQMGKEPKPKTATEASRIDRERALFGPFGIRKEYTGKACYKVSDEPASDVEVVYPLKNKTFSECAKDAGITLMPCFKSENMEPLAPEEAFKKAFNEAMEEMTASMKNAGEQIKYGLESMKKATEPIKVDISIDGEKFSKLIKDYGKPMARSGGD